MTTKTYYHIILDRSGSMQDCIEPTISGYNEQLQVLQSLQKRFPDQTITVGLTLFNDAVTPGFFDQAPGSITPLDREAYVPYGGTALLDAIGTSVLKLKDVAGNTIESGTASVVVVILTDGYENSSTLFTHRGIKTLIRDLEATGKWTFTYLGATVDAVEVAKGLNIKVQNSMAFSKKAVQASYAKLGSSMEQYMEEKANGNIVTDFLKKGGG
jgi:hypothetical protein